MAASQGYFYAKCRIAQINYETSTNKFLQDFDDLLLGLQKRAKKGEREAQFFGVFIMPGKDFP